MVPNVLLNVGIALIVELLGPVTFPPPEVELMVVVPEVVETEMPVPPTIDWAAVVSPFMLVMPPLEPCCGHRT